MHRLANIETMVRTDGYAIAENVLSPSRVIQLLASLENIGEAKSIRKQGGIFAVRNLLDVSPEVRELANAEAVRALVEPVLGERFFPVRGILFDKIPDANWKVPWHQDVTIAVQERVETKGYGPWSMKADVLHVQPRPRCWSIWFRCDFISTIVARRMEPCVSFPDRIFVAAYRKKIFRPCARHPKLCALLVSAERW